MPYGDKPPAKKTPNPPNFQPRPPQAKPSGSRPPRPAMPKGPGTATGPTGPQKQKYPTDPARGMGAQMLPMKPKAAGAASTTKKVKSFMKKYGQA